jgi:hypothetical protein
MAILTCKATVQVTLPSAEAQEFLAELTLGLGLRVRLHHGRVTERETRLVLEIDGDSAGVLEGTSLCADWNRRGPTFSRAS